MALALQGDYGTALVFLSRSWSSRSCVRGYCLGLLYRGGRSVRRISCNSRKAPILPTVLPRGGMYGVFVGTGLSADAHNGRRRAAGCSVLAPEGWLKSIGAASTDLVFGILCEEMGLILALTAVSAVLILAILRFDPHPRTFLLLCDRGVRRRCLMVFQMSLNVFGSVDILPLTGVTFPFVSTGGSSMVACWALLAFF